ncbi:MAG: DNA alkylation repair protein [Lachnospiraceae bacterium]|nr:DNA alkylation repair protein [Lachnospiraceae bacterium]
MSVYEQLMNARDEKYRQFQIKLVPSIDPDTIIGVRTPAMRAVAKDVYRNGDWEAFLDEAPHRYYEEKLVHFFIVAMIRDFDACVARVEAFLPYVDCWPISDQATPTCFKKYHEQLLPYIRKWMDSDHVYTARFGMRMLMNEFLDADFKEEYLEWVADKQGEDYYLKMMQAWYFATALAKQYDATVTYIEEHRLSDWVHKKSIQKAVESFRVSEEHKAYLKSFR